MASIEQRLASLEADLQVGRDLDAIRQVIAAYAVLVDGAADDERARHVAELWTEDGVYDIGGVGICRGREETAAIFADDHFGQVAEGVCHVMGLPHITLSGDTAVAFNYSCVFRHDGDGRFFAWRVSANRWDMIRDRASWKIARRINRPMSGDPEALALLRGIDAPLDLPWT